MNRKTIIALVVFIALGAVALFAIRQPEKGDVVNDHPSPFAKLDPAQIDTLEVTKGGATTVIKNEGGKYKVTSPLSYPADEASAKTAFEGLGKMKVTDLVTQQPGKHADFEVDAKAVHVVAKHGTQVLVDFLIGKSMGPGTAIRQPTSDDVWMATGLSRWSFDKSPTDWRDKSITTFPVADVERLDVVTKDGARIAVKKTGTKQGSEDKWEVVDSSLKVDKLDDTVPNGMATSLSIWKANDFADGMTAAAAGLDPPALTVTATLKGGKKVVALLGNGAKEDEVYAKVPDAPQVYIVKKYNEERVNKRPIQFRDKTMCDITEANLAEVAVTRGENSYTLVNDGKAWKVTKPARVELEPTKASPIAAAFKEWKATAFAEQATPSSVGLVKPKAVIAVKARAKGAPGCLVKVGDLTKDNLSYNLTSGKGNDVYVVPKWSVDRILVKVDDLRKSGTIAKK